MFSLINKKIKPSILNKNALFFYIPLFISLLISISISKVPDQTIIYSSIFIIAAIFSTTFIKEFLFGPKAWILTILAIAISAIYSNYKFIAFPHRVSGFQLDPNIYSALIYSAISLSILFVSNKQAKYSLILLFAITLAETNSRSGIGLFITLCLAVFILKRHLTKQTIKYFFHSFLIFISVYICIQFYTSYLSVNFTRESITSINDGSLGIRLLIWSDALKLIPEHIFFGSGYGLFFSLYPSVRSQEFSTEGSFVHNDYLQVLIEGGLVGLSIWVFLGLRCSFILYSLVVKKEDINKRENTILIPLTLLLISLLIHSFFNFIFYALPTCIITLLIWLFIEQKLNHKEITIHKHIMKYTKWSTAITLIIINIIISQVAILESKFKGNIFDKYKPSFLTIYQLLRTFNLDSYSINMFLVKQNYYHFITNKQIPKDVRKQLLNQSYNILLDLKNSYPRYPDILTWQAIYLLTKDRGLKNQAIARDLLKQVHQIHPGYINAYKVEFSIVKGSIEERLAFFCSMHNISYTWTNLMSLEEGLWFFETQKKISQSLNMPVLSQAYQTAYEFFPLKYNFLYSNKYWQAISLLEKSKSNCFEQI
ncbi:O-antigen ligase family protein [Zooshikella ganghwensis]|nr:O-antigen ligase family protein [Zooshikella ganghwensis]